MLNILSKLGFCFCLFIFPIVIKIFISSGVKSFSSFTVQGNVDVLTEAEDLKENGCGFFFKGVHLLVRVEDSSLLSFNLLSVSEFWQFDEFRSNLSMLDLADLLSLILCESFAWTFWSKIESLLCEDESSSASSLSLESSEEEDDDDEDDEEAECDIEEDELDEDEDLLELDADADEEDEEDADEVDDDEVKLELLVEVETFDDLYDNFNFSSSVNSWFIIVLIWN